MKYRLETSVSASTCTSIFTKQPTICIDARIRRVGDKDEDIVTGIVEQYIVWVSKPIFLCLFGVTWNDKIKWATKRIDKKAQKMVRKLIVSDSKFLESRNGVHRYLNQQA